MCCVRIYIYVCDGEGDCIGLLIGSPWQLLELPLGGPERQGASLERPRREKERPEQVLWGVQHQKQSLLCFSELKQGREREDK